MKFWLLETDSIDYKIPNREIDFPEITEGMVEEDEHLEILDKYLKDADLDSFSTFFSFDTQREIYAEHSEIDKIVELVDFTISDIKSGEGTDSLRDLKTIKEFLINLKGK